jgi:hypothetical protein
MCALRYRLITSALPSNLKLNQISCCHAMLWNLLFRAVALPVGSVDISSRRFEEIYVPLLKGFRRLVSDTAKKKKKKKSPM